MCEFPVIELLPVLSAVQWSAVPQHTALAKCLSGVTLLFNSCKFF